MPRPAIVGFVVACTLGLMLPVAAAGATEEVVTITESLRPALLEIDVGATVTWRNRDGERHRMRSDEGPERFDSGNLDQGQSFSFTFAIEGSYPYHDHRDRDDSAYFGTIIVGGAGIDIDGPPPESGALSIVNRSFRPPSFSIATGGTVEWSNDDGEAHTVTSADQAFDSGIIDGGGTFSETFAEPGSYPYFCLIHPEMRGTITVADAVDGPAPVDDVAAGPDPGQTVPEPALDAALGALPEAATTVSTIDRSFQPGAVEVVAGDDVRWTNDDREGHTVTAVDGTFDSGVMTVGDGFSHVFDAPGTFDYFCAIHPEMTGSVTVSEPIG
jgi:plastocyanin